GGRAGAAVPGCYGCNLEKAPAATAFAFCAFDPIPGCLLLRRLRLTPAEGTRKQFLVSAHRSTTSPLIWLSVPSLRHLAFEFDCRHITAVGASGPCPAFYFRVDFLVVFLEIFNALVPICLVSRHYLQNVYGVEKRTAVATLYQCLFSIDEIGSSVFTGIRRVSAAIIYNSPLRNPRAHLRRVSQRDDVVRVDFFAHGFLCAGVRRFQAAMAVAAS